MDDDVKSRFDDVERRYASLEKRIDDVKWYVSGVAMVFGVIFGLVSLIMNWRFDDEKTTLRQFQTEIRQAIGKTESPPDLELRALNKAIWQARTSCRQAVIPRCSSTTTARAV